MSHKYKKVYQYYEKVRIKGVKKQGVSKVIITRKFLCNETLSPYYEDVSHYYEILSHINGNVSYYYGTGSQYEAFSQENLSFSLL